MVWSVLAGGVVGGVGVEEGRAECKEASAEEG